MESFENLKLSIAQLQDLNRAQNALHNLWEWLEKLDPETDAKLAEIIKAKTTELLKKIDRKFSEVLKP